MTLAEAQELYAAYLEAERVILKNQTYTVGAQTFQKADLRTVQAERKRLAQVITQLSACLLYTSPSPRDKF